MSHKTYKDLESFYDGEVVIYRRNAGMKPTYQARIKTPQGTGYIIRSLKTSDRDEAYRKAIDLFDELKYRAKAGEDLKSRLATKVIDEYLASQTHKSRFVSSNKQIGDHFRSFLGSKPMATIDARLMAGYFANRRTQRHKGKKISENTLHAEAGEITRFLRWAKEMKYLREVPSFEKPKLKANPRPVFDEKAYRTLTSNARHWIAKASHPSVKRDRVLLWNYVLILANTGIRVGEARELQWRDIRIINQPAQEQLIFAFRVSGKTGMREVVARTGEIKNYLERIRELREAELGKTPTLDSPIFCHPDGSKIGSFKKSFSSLIKYCDVEYDRDGNRRTLYSLRHTYATFRLYEGVNHYTLAQNMGTSVEMIERFYGHTSNIRQAGELTKTGRGLGGANIFDFIQAENESKQS